eukprot:1022357-Amphidinium_carterae.2
MESAMPLLLSAQADILFAGHVHAYERLGAIDGMRHFVVGNGGNHEELYNEWDIIKESLYHDGTKYGWGELQLGGFNSSLWRAWGSVDRKLQEALHLDHTPQENEPDFQAVGTQSLPALLLLVALLAVASFGMGFWSQYNRRKRRLLGTQRQKSFSEHTRVLGAQTQNVSVT